MAAIDEKRLEDRLTALESARTWSPRIISKLESHIRSANDAELLRINPLKFAADKNLAETETVDLLLHASALGLFEMNWVILCPLCSCVIDSFRALRNLDSHCRCTICHVDLVADLDDMIAVTFTISPTIRRTTFHNPDQLSVADYCFRYKSTMDGLVADGTPFTAIKEEVTVALSYLAPGEITEIEVMAESGLLRAFSPDTDAGFLMAVDPTLPVTETRLSIRCDGETCDPADGTVAPGKLTFGITNSSSKRLAFGIFCIPSDFALPPLHFAPFLSGKQLLTTQTFRDLFRSEVIRGQEGLGVKDIALLFTDLKGSTALYDRIGDLNAFALVQQHFDRLQDVTVRHNGAIIKTIGDAVMAAFIKPADAVQAALDMRKRDRLLQREATRQGADPQNRRPQGSGNRGHDERSVGLFRADCEHRRARAKSCRR